MDLFEAWMAKETFLVKKASLAGRPDLVPAIQLAVRAGDDTLYKDLAQLLDDILLVTDPEIHPFIPGPVPGDLPDDGVAIGRVVGS